MRFSERLGLVPSASALAPDAMPEHLRTSLWNVLQLQFWGREGFVWSNRRYNVTGEIMPLAQLLWFRFFKRAIDTIPKNPERVTALTILREFNQFLHGAFPFSGSVFIGTRAISPPSIITGETGVMREGCILLCDRDPKWSSKVEQAGHGGRPRGSDTAACEAA